MSVADGQPALQPDLLTRAEYMAGTYLPALYQIAMDTATRVMAVSTSRSPGTSSDTVRLIYPDGTLGSTSGLAGATEPTNTSLVGPYNAVQLAMKARSGLLTLLQPLFYNGVAGAMLRRYPLPGGPVALLSHYPGCAGGPLAVDAGGGVAFCIGANLVHVTAAGWATPITLATFVGTPLGMDYDGAGAVWLASSEVGVGYHLYRYDTSMHLVATITATWATSTLNIPPGDLAILGDGPLASSALSGVADLCIDRARGALYLLDANIQPYQRWEAIGVTLSGAVRRLDIGTLDLRTICGGAYPFISDSLATDLLPGADRDGASLHRFQGGRAVACGPDGAVYWSQGISGDVEEDYVFHNHYGFIFRAGCP